MEVVFLNETWFTTNMSHSKEWVGSTQSVTSSSYRSQVPLGEGGRFVVAAAGTADGFIRSASPLRQPAVTTMVK